MRKLLTSIASAFLLLSPMLVSAQITVGGTGLDETGEAVYGSLGDETLGTYIGNRIITPFFGVLGILFLLLIIYAGFLWMTGMGNPTRVTKAKDILTQAIIGLVITLAAYAFTNFIFDAFAAPAP